MTEIKTTVERPLSPHLQVYRLTLTMVMSGLHRITGVALYIGTLLLVWWLLAAATSKSFEVVNGFFGSWFGSLILFGYTWALIHHLVGGLRYLIWDTGRGLGAAEREFFAWVTIVSSITLTFIIWMLGFMFKG
jgi:succinate dehydrogenase / fumarate reductase cytochrome b subunit